MELQEINIRAKIKMGFTTNQTLQKKISVLAEIATETIQTEAERAKKKSGKQNSASAICVLISIGLI